MPLLARVVSLVLFVAAALLARTFGFAKTLPAHAQQVLAQAPFPTYERFDDFAAVHLDNRHPDTTYVVNFWATWCGPCVKELPYFEALHAKAEAEGLPIKVTLVTIDLPMAYGRSLLPFLEARQLRAEVVGLLDGDANAWIDRVDPSWSGAIPVTLFLRGGERHFADTPYHSLAELEAALP